MDDRNIEQLARLFLKFPGIGARQARRFSYFIAGSERSFADNLSRAIIQTRGNAHICEQCFRIFEGSGAVCDICADTTRDHSTLMVVEKSQDIESFQTTDYRGLFFVLGGLIPITSAQALAGVRAKELDARVQKDSFKDSSGDDVSGSLLQELILAFPLTPNGDHTDTVMRERLSALAPTLRLTSLGRGLSIGTELEYADPLSLNASLKKRE